MKQLILTILIGLFIVSCGSIKIDTDVDDAVEALIEAGEDYISSEGESGSEANSGASSDDSEGVSNVFETDSGNSQDRYFIGTFKEQYAYQNCANWPNTIRLYSYQNYIDLEDNTQNRISKAVQFEDDTFDFTVTYLDSLGNPDIDLTCTCSITVEQYYNDEMDCDCDSDEMDSCKLYYEKIE